MPRGARSTGGAGTAHAAAPAMHSQSDAAAGAKRARMDELQHPHIVAGWLSRLTWTWFFPLLMLGRRKQLDDRDVWNLPPKSRARALHTRYVERTREFPDMSLREHLVRMFWRRWVYAGVCYFGWCVSAACQPYLVAAIVNHVADDEADVEHGLLLALALFVATLFYSFFINHKFAQLMENGVEIRSVLMTLLYRKILAVSLAEGISTGEATNLLSNDAERVLDATLWFHYMCVACGVLDWRWGLGRVGQNVSHNRCGTSRDVPVCSGAYHLANVALYLQVGKPAVCPRGHWARVHRARTRGVCGVWTAAAADSDPDLLWEDCRVTKAQGHAQNRS